MSWQSCRPGPAVLTAGVVCVMILGVLIGFGCTPFAFVNATAPLSNGDLADVDDARLADGLRRAPIGVGVINRTPYRAIGTFGGYDPQDQETIVTFGQLGVTEGFDLEPNGVTPVYALPTTRAFTLGGRRIIDLVFDNDLQKSEAVLRSYPTGATFGTYVPAKDLLKVNIGFTGAPFGDPQGSVPSQGTAEAMTVYLGYDYTRDSILIFDLLEDANAPGGFVIAYRESQALGVDRDRLVLLSPNARAVYLAPLDLDRQTFQLLTGLGTVTVGAPLFTLDIGEDPNVVKVTIDNQSSSDVSVALFGTDSLVIPTAAGTQAERTVAPGFYEYVIATSGENSALLLNSQMLNGRAEATLALTSTSL
ncbi:MAG: hypothetical protein JXQ73_15260 [Phycisphaerae bacterium]|nr:hypothetical protein [Phycisphaerae bacterium]